MVKIPGGTFRSVFRRGIGTGPGLLILALAAPLGGCGKSGEMTYPSTNLGGWVYLDEVPIHDGVIVFRSMDPKINAVIMTKITRGRYIAENVPLGSVRAYIGSVKDMGRGAPKVNIIPQRYQIGIELEVTRNSSRVDFRLVTAEPTEDTGAGAAADKAKAGTEPETDAEPKPAGAAPEPDAPPPGTETPKRAGLLRDCPGE